MDEDKEKKNFMIYPSPKALAQILQNDPRLKPSCQGSISIKVSPNQRLGERAHTCR